MTSLDTILLSVLRSAQEAGLYGAPYRLFLAFMMVGTFAAYATLGPMARATNIGAERAAVATARLRYATVPLAGYGLMILGLAELFGGDILSVLFGARFSAMEDVFVILAIAVPWYSFAFPVGYALIARGANRLFLVGAGVAGVLNIGLNLVLIPSYGPEGAAVATSVGIVGGAIVWLSVQGFLDRDFVRVLGPVTVLSLGSVVVLAFDGGAVIAGACTVAFGVVMVAMALRDSTRLSGPPMLNVVGPS